MKKFVKIISVVMCALLLVTGFFFAPKNMNSFMLSTHAATTQADTRASGQTYNFTGEVNTSTSMIPDYAINDIEYYSYSSYFLIKATFSIPAYFGIFQFDFNLADLSQPFFEMLVINFNNDSYFDVNMCFIPHATNQFYLNEQYSSPISTVTCLSNSDNALIDVYFSNMFFNVDFDSRSFTLIDSLTTSDRITLSFDSFNKVDDLDFSYLFDMDSATNFDMFLNSYINENCFSKYLVDVFSSSNSWAFFNPNGTQSRFVNAFVWCKVRNIFIYEAPCTRVGFIWFNTPTSKTYDYILNDLYFYIYEPTYRVNNTLVIYNFDYYNYLQYSSGVSYTLRKQNDFYNVDYSGSLPNSKFIYVFNDSIQNTIFDEYIKFYLKFINGSIDFVSFYDSSSNSLNFPLGFDFNFTYYTQPLVASNGSYNYVFNKPGYVDMNFSLSPFYIPVLEMVENVMIFLLFYCPITCDIVELLNFDKFMGGLIQIFNMFINSQIGDFIMGAFAFLVLWGILSSLLPKALTSARSIYSNSQFVYNRRRNREDRQKERLQQKEVKYTQKMIKVEERYNKRRRKKE